MEIGILFLGVLLGVLIVLYGIFSTLNDKRGKDEIDKISNEITALNEEAARIKKKLNALKIQCDEILKPDLLTPSERTYLKAVLEPYRKTIKAIVKNSTPDGSTVILTLHTYEVTHRDESAAKDYYGMMTYDLPTFKNTYRFNKMEDDVEYSLKELRL